MVRGSHVALTVGNSTSSPRISSGTKRTLSLAGNANTAYAINGNPMIVMENLFRRTGYLRC